MVKRVIVACGSGVATSQTVASKVERMLSEKGIDVQVDAVDIKSLETFVKNAHAYIAISKPEKDYGVPVFNGIAFLTGIGIEQELNSLIEVLCQK